MLTSARCQVLARSAPLQGYGYRMAAITVCCPHVTTKSKAERAAKPITACAGRHGDEKNPNHHRLEVPKPHIQTPDNPHVFTLSCVGAAHATFRHCASSEAGSSAPG